MDIDVFNAVINGGGTAILVYLVIDMRRQQRDRDAQIWALLDWLIRDRAESQGKAPPPTFPPT